MILSPHVRSGWSQYPACWEPGFQAWAQSPCPELSAQGLVPLRWGCALPSPNVLCLEEFHDLRGTPQDEAGFMRKFETTHVGAAKC